LYRSFPTLTKAGFEVHIESGRALRPAIPIPICRQGRENRSESRRRVRRRRYCCADLCYGSNTSRKQDVPLYRRDQILIGFLRPFGAKDVCRKSRAVASPRLRELMPRTTPPKAWTRSFHGTACGYKPCSWPPILTRAFSHAHHAAGTSLPRACLIGCGVADFRPSRLRAPGRGNVGVHLRPREGAGAESWRTLRRTPIEAKDAQDARGYATAQARTFTGVSASCSEKRPGSDVVITTAVIPGKSALLSPRIW